MIAHLTNKIKTKLEVFALDDKTMDAAIVEAKRQYYRAYREKNRERIKANNERFWARKAEKLRGENDAQAVTVK